MHKLKAHLQNKAQHSLEPNLMQDKKKSRYVLNWTQREIVTLQNCIYLCYSANVYWHTSYVNNCPKCRGYSEQDKQIYSFQRAYIVVGEAKNKDMP